MILLKNIHKSVLREANFLLQYRLARENGRYLTMVLKKKVLVVEDQIVNRSILCNILADTYEVLEAGNGCEALEILEQHGENISLILLDIVMPVMDGYTFLDIVKSTPAYSAVPVIVTTQQDAESDEVAALSHGAADYVVKPYKPRIILHRVASIINLRETAAMINLVRHDRLTGLFSKEFFFEKVREVLSLNPGKRYDMICSDIENFKMINDIFGVPAADRLLCGIAEKYRNNVQNNVCCRINADQFACLLEHKSDYSFKMFSDALDDVNAMTEIKNVMMKWGIYSITGDEPSVEQMYDRALMAAQSIKGQYGQLFAIYDDELREKTLRMQKITESMESALEKKQFEIYLQPKYRLCDNVLVGAEALVRWNHPEWGMQSPAEFVPLFEKNGFITKLDRYVWDMTCGVLERWDKAGITAVPVSVNVSRADLHHADIAGLLLEMLERHRIEPERLHLEITESAYTESIGQIVDTVEHLRSLGFVIEMDDFGSGYSSLSMLDKMPVDVLKVDMHFVQNETETSGGEGILQFIMLLAKWKGLTVVAEGIETEEQLRRLKNLGCDCAQGFYFAKPMPVSDFEKLISEPMEEQV